MLNRVIETKGAAYSAPGLPHHLRTVRLRPRRRALPQRQPRALQAAPPAPPARTPRRARTRPGTCGPAATGLATRHLLQLVLSARFGQIAGLTPHDVDLPSGRIAIRRRFSPHAGTVRATKNHRYRLLDIPHIARSTLQRLVEGAGSPPSLPDLDDREWEAAPFRRHWLIQTATGRPSCNSAFNRNSRLPAAPRSATLPKPMIATTPAA